MTEDEFFDFCQEQEGYKIERNSDGTIIIYEPEGFYSSKKNSALGWHLESWNRQYKLGEVTGTSGGYILPNSATRGPDAAWVSFKRLKSVPPKELKKFPHLVPEFVIELRSETDRLKKLRQKMEEYIANGVLLAWLIDPKTETSYIYRADGSLEELQGFDRILSGEDVLPGFELPLAELR